MQKNISLDTKRLVKKVTTYLSETCLFLNTIREWELQFGLIYQTVVSEQGAFHFAQCAIPETAPPRWLPRIGVKIGLSIQDNLPVRLESKKENIIVYTDL